MEVGHKIDKQTRDGKGDFREKVKKKPRVKGKQAEEEDTMKKRSYSKSRQT